MGLDWVGCDFKGAGREARGSGPQNQERILVSWSWERMEEAGLPEEGCGLRFGMGLQWKGRGNLRPVCL